MKKTIITMLMAAMTMGAAAQRADGGLTENAGQCKSDTTETKSNNGPEASVLPQFPGGQEALMKFLKKKMKYPDLAEQYDVEGSIVMHFTVDADGSIKDISATDCKTDRFNTTKFSQETEARQKELKKQFALLFAKEGARVVRKMPKWIPASVNGIPVSVKYNLTIRFANPNK
jgi:protein TonB